MRALALTTLTASILAAGVPLAAQDWPGFRGPQARGVADGQELPASWDLESGRNVRWRTAIPGTAHSSPVVSGDRVFVTTAVTEADGDLVLGDAGGIRLAGDTAVPHSWRIYCLDKTDGRVLWEREVFAGRPRATRHVKASQANATPATDGERVIAIFGSEGMVALDVSGRELWRVDLGVLDPGLFGDPSSQWGASSSPVIFEDLVIVQVDRHAESFLAAYETANGRQVWRVARDEKPVWSTPTLHRTPERTELIVIGGDWDRGYDPRTGRELWRYARDYEVKTPTPFVADGKVILAGGYRGRPVYALEVGTSGEIAAGGSHDGLAWISEPGGPYTSTPVAYGDYLFFVRDTGIFTVLSLADGSMVHRERTDSTFSASPVASDGRLYLTGEEGVVTVVSARPGFEVVARNEMGEPCMATPAISGGTLLVRCRSTLYAIGSTGE